MTYIGPDEGREIGPETLTTLRERVKDGQRWAAYQNHDLSSANVGEIRFLLVGPGATFLEPPPRYPDTHLGLGWRYLLAGTANLETGRVDDLAPAPAEGV